MVELSWIEFCNRKISKYLKRHHTPLLFKNGKYNNSETSAIMFNDKNKIIPKETSQLAKCLPGKLTRFLKIPSFKQLSFVNP